MLRKLLPVCMIALMLFSTMPTNIEADELMDESNVNS